MGAVRHVADIRADDMNQDGQGVINLQAGTNKFASQKGMSFGAVRHVADIRADEMDQEGCGVIGLQSGEGPSTDWLLLKFSQKLEAIVISLCTSATNIPYPHLMLLYAACFQLCFLPNM